ncbi:MAG: type I methionyl aminopeptidase [Solirubrobacteraceae bacterium]
MSIETREELEGLEAAGRVVAEAIRSMRLSVGPGVTTGELDAIGARVFRQAGARSGPKLDYDFPGVNCISVNDEAVHGIPSPRHLHDGDLVKLDVTAELDGFYADACVSVPVGRPRRSTMALMAAAQAALTQALGVARTGTPINQIGRAVQHTIEQRGYAVCPDLSGHGIGRRIHEDPMVLNHYVPGDSQPLTDGLVITIEPIISTGTGAVRQAKDGWTITTADGTLSAHVEHTVVITDSQPIIPTI